MFFKKNVIKYEIDPTFGDCFPASLTAEISISETSGSFPFDFPSGNDLLEIEKLWVDNVTYSMRVINNLPFPVSIILNMTNGTENPLFDTGSELDNIMPYTSPNAEEASFFQPNHPQRIDKSSIGYFIKTTIGGDTTDDACDILPGGGWIINHDSTSGLSMIIDYDFGLIDSVRISTNSINSINLLTYHHPLIGNNHNIIIIYYFHNCN